MLFLLPELFNLKNLENEFDLEENKTKRENYRNICTQ